MRVLTVYGGVGYEPQLDTLKSGVDIVVGTPGRLIDLANRRALDLSHVHALVLDEADEMLDLGFLPDVEQLISMTPETRQTMLFSATMPAAIVSLARIHMRHPMNIRAESSDDTEMVPATAQFIYQTHDLDKPEIIGRVLQAEDADKIIVFTRTKRQAQRIADDLAERGFAAAPAARRHGAGGPREGARPSSARTSCKVLVATDVAARGIDVRGVSHVINYSCPEDEKTYVHRIGRTGRAGRDRHRHHVRRLGRPAPLEDDQQGARPAVRRSRTETYSTSEHLFHDQGIPPGTKGRIVDPAPVERKPRDDRGDRGPTATTLLRRRTATATAAAAAPAAAPPSRVAPPPPPRRARPPRPRTSPPARAATATGVVVRARAVGATRAAAPAAE